MNTIIEQRCQLFCWNAKWLQKFANAKAFLIIYGLLGTIEAMATVYFIITLTTLEKRFKFNSQTTGLILSGNEISQICLSLILSYIAGQRHRPRWIAYGTIFSALSCFILAIPHFLYGSGEDVSQLTQEWYDTHKNISFVNSTVTTKLNKLCNDDAIEPENCSEFVSIVPLVLIFLSQFVLGVGNTLYYSLGQTYLDDNTHKSNSPKMLAYSLSYRLIGPVFGFLLGFITLNVFIDPHKTPLITNKDPRWLGAWWLGWIIIGILTLIFSMLIGMFPKELPKTKNDYTLVKAPVNGNCTTDDDHHGDDYDDNDDDERDRLPATNCSTTTTMDSSFNNIPKLSDFPSALMRLLKNKLLMLNIGSIIFYVLGSSGYITYMSKYMEVQFNKAPADATIVAGPVTIVGMVTGFLMSGHVISKYKPNSRQVFFWTLLVGAIYMLGQITFIFFHCEDIDMMEQYNGFNLTTNCNQNCSCDTVAYNPICYKTENVTFFSPFHAGCSVYDDINQVYSNCSCIDEMSLSGNDQQLFKFPYESTTRPTRSYDLMDDLIDLKVGIPGECLVNCAVDLYIFIFISFTIHLFAASGRVGSVLLSFRVVTKEDKSFAQGLGIMFLSLFAAVPAPIIYGYLIDTTCILWNNHCEKSGGNCQLYDKKQFRQYFNLLACSLTFVSVMLDAIICYYCKNIDFYDEDDLVNDEEISNGNDENCAPIKQ